MNQDSKRSKRSIPATFLTILAIVISASCEKKSGLPARVDLSTLSGNLKSFDVTTQDRSKVSSSTTLMFEDLSYYVSTREIRKKGDRKWEYISDGRSRDTAYFVVPRMEWADTIEDVEKIICEDYKRGIGIPTSTLVE